MCTTVESLKLRRVKRPKKTTTERHSRVTVTAVLAVLLDNSFKTGLKLKKHTSGGIIKLKTSPTVIYRFSVPLVPLPLFVFKQTDLTVV